MEGLFTCLFAIFFIYKLLGPAMHACLVAQSCLTLSNPLGYSLPGSSDHRIFQARILEWVVVSFSRASSWPRDWTWIFCVSCVAGGFLYLMSHWENCRLLWTSQVALVVSSLRRCWLRFLTYFLVGLFGCFWCWGKQFFCLKALINISTEYSCLMKMFAFQPKWCTKQEFNVGHADQTALLF